ncbi:5-formyltetrahydrofolate cyclo-ligase [Nitrosophilus kaiyonis]|uniref:5-formyltetrahydrofolate cyclo-ligase n=1 Tax=Nitrosophilus kaiyonis TaxID=2930200 RepID=UPI002490FCBD|nr:5-formyltetrahydrofolate cyclo-ligase [Nitrosophilus kaiyonis]
MAVFNNKSEFRNFCLKKLNLITSYERRVFSKKINQIIEDIIISTNVKNILFYMPMIHEPDIRVLFKKYRKNKNLFLPFMEGKSFKMVKYRLPLKTKKFNIKEPANSFYKLSKLDIAIVPVIGVDRDFRRVGFGKGMYDRFFANLSYRPLIIFVELKRCLTYSKITDSYDVLGDLYITPKEIIIRGESDVGRDIGRKFCRYNKWRCRIFNSKKSRKK